LLHIHLEAIGKMKLLLGMDGNPVVDQLSEDGFVDLTFRIDALVEDEQHYRFHLAASYQDQEVGLDVVLRKGICSAFDAAMNISAERWYDKGVCFVRTGQESDRLIVAIAELYGPADLPRRMVPTESFTAIALHQGPLDFSKKCVKLKLFGKDGEPFCQDDYYESFFNVDLANRLVYWNEKDQEYRRPLIRALTNLTTDH
jgi:hypothetical protein